MLSYWNRKFAIPNKEDTKLADLLREPPKNLQHLTHSLENLKKLQAEKSTSKSCELSWKSQKCYTDCIKIVIKSRSSPNSYFSAFLSLIYCISNNISIYFLSTLNLTAVLCSIFQQKLKTILCRTVFLNCLLNNTNVHIISPYGNKKNTSVS